MNPALSHWYPPPPSQDDEDEFYDPFENGADTWNWKIHMCLICMICLWSFWSWTFVYHCETSPSMMKTQMLSGRPKWFLQGSCWWMNSDSHWNMLYKTRFLMILPLLGKIISFKLVELTTYIAWPRWEENTKYVPGTNWKTRSWVRIKILRWHDDKLRKTMFCWISMAITQLYSIIIYHKLGIVQDIFAQPLPYQQKNSSSKVQSCCLGWSASFWFL